MGMLNVLVSAAGEEKFDLTYAGIDEAEIERILQDCERGGALSA